MRTEQQMFDLILATARDDDRIRAVIMNGSRANPTAPCDFFQDYDIVYLVTDVEPFRHNLEWIARFGELMILQLPDEMDDPPPVDAPGFAYLMQFADGNRIDLTIHPVGRLDALEEDSQTIVLLDKDGIPPAVPAGQRPRLLAEAADRQTVRGLLQRVLVGVALCGEGPVAPGDRLRKADAG
jgi:aminoglycoside 6-adenylyltransferase